MLSLPSHLPPLAPHPRSRALFRSEDIRRIRSAGALPSFLPSRRTPRWRARPRARSLGVACMCAPLAGEGPDAPARVASASTAPFDVRAARTRRAARRRRASSLTGDEHGDERSRPMSHEGSKMSHQTQVRTCTLASSRTLTCGEHSTRHMCESVARASGAGGRSPPLLPCCGAICKLLSRPRGGLGGLHPVELPATEAQNASPA